MVKNPGSSSGTTGYTLVKNPKPTMSKLSRTPNFLLPFSHYQFVLFVHIDKVSTRVVTESGGSDFVERSAENGERLCGDSSSPIGEEVQNEGEIVTGSFSNILFKK